MSTQPNARRLRLTGHVQGVGYRPFVHRLAHALGVMGWVKNVTGAVEIHAEGSAAVLERFADALVSQAPAIARPRLADCRDTTPEGHGRFAILTSEGDSAPDIHVPPDYFTCDDCLAELRDPADRRHGYPFINCTQCGPRYTLITALPYDRPSTAMADFPLCPACRKEYEDPADRRFHAEPVACPVCGPHLEYVESGGAAEAGQTDAQAIARAAACLHAGGIVAVKGIGGYHLLCDAASDTAVATLRRRKPRPGKPLALLFPDLPAVRRVVVSDAASEALLASPARPIVLLPRRDDAGISAGIAPGLGEVGCFLAYSPLHHLLLAAFGAPLVATSGNLGGEPVLTDNAEAQARLARVADAFLHHDRPIVRPADDSVFRPIAGLPRPLRLGRGTAPLELELPDRLPTPVLALGAHTKNTLCLAWDDRAVISPHIGDLDAARGRDTLARVAADLQRLYQVRAQCLLLDAHPAYGYRDYARQAGLPQVAIHHHRAHASALAWEYPEVREWIVFAWDGVGLGEDGSLWGGEAYCGRPGAWRRRASLRPFRLPGGERAARQPWRSAAALLWECGQAAAFAPELLHAAFQRGLNSPPSSAAGRLFDAAAALIGICREASFEGEAPMRLEAAAVRMPPPPASGGEPTPASPALVLRRETPDAPSAALDGAVDRAANGLWRADWSPLLPMLGDASLSQEARAYRFHLAMADALLAQARCLRDETGAIDVGFTGGVFQNRLLTELALQRLAAAGFRVHLGRRVPVNDAGISFGQVIEFMHAAIPASPIPPTDKEQG